MAETWGGSTKTGNGLSCDNEFVTPIFETTRLWLRPWELADAEQVQPLFSQLEVVRLLVKRGALAVSGGWGSLANTTKN